jgi:hypothetical protein
MIHNHNINLPHFELLLILKLNTNCLFTNQIGDSKHFLCFFKNTKMTTPKREIPHNFFFNICISTTEKWIATLKIFRCICLQSHLQTSTPKPRKSYPWDNFWKYPPSLPKSVKVRGRGGPQIFFDWNPYIFKFRRNFNRSWCMWLAMFVFTKYRVRDCRG